MSTRAAAGGPTVPRTIRARRQSNPDQPMLMTSDSALVLFSGGQDSTTCLAWALDRFSEVETIGFDYGQRHAVELACRPILREKLTSMAHPGWGRLGPDHLIRLDALGQISDTALTRDVEIAT